MPHHVIADDHREAFELLAHDWSRGQRPTDVTIDDRTVPVVDYLRGYLVPGIVVEDQLPASVAEDVQVIVGRTATSYQRAARRLLTTLR